ncbi:GNAT family N-acetyltransferase [Phaeovibrio sulfidiphilus]|uniref:GNAT family N-acetyltransferase n=1 Tax=Phaeovibrio sulfidiphilus TaxID=1220600 RepID=A0A8J6YJ89_9PROT|nr:N-acetyltransferase [Phaeovibrio sulfidiphilus]MBE1237341.1 GNAT family N-acetyltransferase [Phaeovibrio sulfidiphilus]
MELTPASVTIRIAGAADAPTLSALHGAAFSPRGERPWTADEITALTQLPGMTAFLASDDSGPVGMAMILDAGGEAEIAVICVDPRCQRLGIGRLLLDEIAHVLEARGTEALHLEVARDNEAAIALYTGRGFQHSGCRPGYYRRQDGTRMDALVYTLPLAPASPA